MKKVSPLATREGPLSSREGPLASREGPSAATERPSAATGGPSTPPVAGDLPQKFLGGDTGVLEGFCGAPQQGFGPGCQGIAPGRGLQGGNLVREDNKGLPGVGYVIENSDVFLPERVPRMGPCPSGQ